jgi:HPt (histidine-containing phosphotransfer) domain-containing protein
MEGDRELCLAAGMNDYLSKPFRLNNLQTVLNRWLPPKGESFAKAESRERVCSSQQGSKKGMLGDTKIPGRKHEGMIGDSSPIDSKVLNNIQVLQRKGGADLLSRVVRVYLDQSSNLLDDLQDAVHGNDPKAIRGRAHSLKSSSANMGAMRLTTLLKEMEEIGRNGETAKAPSLMLEIQKEYKVVRETLESLLKERER